jgi:hypothetical protein
MYLYVFNVTTPQWLGALYFRNLEISKKQKHDLNQASTATAAVVTWKTLSYTAV